MPQFAANLSMLYPELDFLDRFEAAAKDGFKGVEYLFPYAYDKAELAARLQANGLQQVLFNAPPGDWDKGDKGVACQPGREAEFRDGFARALDYAAALACPRVHVMAGLLPAGVPREAARATYLANLQHAAASAAAQGVDVLIEPINTRDIPGYLLNRQDQAHAIVSAVGADNLKIQMDFYHLQIVEGDITMKYRQYQAEVGHVQIASVPERCEPDSGEVNYPYLFEMLDASGYDAWVGCEYRPRADTSAGLRWLRCWRERH